MDNFPEWFNDVLSKAPFEYETVMKQSCRFSPLVTGPGDPQLFSVFILVCVYTLRLIGPTSHPKTCDLFEALTEVLSLLFLNAPFYFGGSISWTCMRNHPRLIVTFKCNPVSEHVTLSNEGPLLETLDFFAISHVSYQPLNFLS